MRSKACLTIAACRDVVDVVEAVKSSYIPLSLISAARHPLHQAISLLFSVFFFFFTKIGFMLKKYVLKNRRLSDFFASIVLQNKKNSIAEKSLFFLFSFPCFYFHFSSPFFSPYVLPRRSDGRGQDTSPREMSEGNGGNGHQDLKRKSLVGVI